MTKTKRLHLALGVKNITDSVLDYKRRLGVSPEFVIKEEYALFRTESLNLSIRQVKDSELGLRHLGWESEDYEQFTEETDCNGFVWEHFNRAAQVNEVHEYWPHAY